MQERGLISIDNDPQSSPPQLRSPPPKLMLHHSLSTSSSILPQHLQQNHGYRNFQELSLSTNSINKHQQQLQIKDIKPILPVQSLLKSSLLGSSTLSSSSSLSSSTTTSTATTMQYQETKRQEQQKIHATELPIQQYKSILHTHLMSKQVSPSSSCSSGSINATNSLTTCGTTSLLNKNSQGCRSQDIVPHLHNQQYTLPTTKQYHLNQHHQIQGHKNKTATSSTMTTTLLQHFVISTPSTTNNGSTSINSNNNIRKNNSNNYITDVSNSLSFNSSISSSNKTNNVNSGPKSSSNSYQVQTPITSHQTTSTATATTQTQTDDMGMNVPEIDNPSGHHFNVVPSSSDTGIGVLNASEVNSMAGGGTISRHGHSHHHEAVTVVVFKTMLPDD